MEEPVRKLGPYTLVSKIGRGAFGIVWLAEKKSSIATTRFALKLPRDEDIDLEAFKQEAAIWLQASGHPNVVPMIEADMYDEQVVIVSEYVPDGSLAAWLKKHGGRAPSIEAASQMIDGVLAGLAHLHGRSIIHRDLKPDNILLQHETPRLADFGIARLLKSGSYSTNISGTLAYMAPEAFDGKRNEQTDVWSAGVIFYQLLAGRLPYAQSDTASFVGAIMRHDPPPLPESVPEVLQHIVMKALEREPDKRYATATEMRRDLLEAERLLWLKEREAREALPATAKEPPATLVLPQTKETKASHSAAIDPQPTIRANIQREPDHTAEKTIRQASFPMGSPTRSTFDTPDRKVHEATPIIPVKGNSRSLLWLAGVVGALLLGILFTVGVYRWVRSGPSRQTPQAERTKQFSTPETIKPSQGPYELKETITGHSDKVDSVAFSPDGKMLASGSWDETVKVWDVQTGALKLTITGHCNVVDSVAFSPDGKTLAIGCYDKTIKLWDMQTVALKQTLTGHSDQVVSVAFSPDGKTLASGSFDDTIKLWDVQTGALMHTLTGFRGWVFSVAFSLDGKMLASGSHDGTIKLWDVQTGALKQTLTGHSSGVESVAFSPDGKTFASGSRDNTVKLWDVQTGSLKQTLTGHDDMVESIAFSPDGKTLASGSYDKTIKLWQGE